MAYEVRALRRYKARYDSDNSDNLLRVALVRDGAKVNLTTGDTCTITTYHPSLGSTAIEEDTEGTVTNGSSVVTFAIDTSADTDNYTTRTGYRGDITFTVSDQEYPGHVIFDVAPYLLHIPVSVDQLLDRDPRLRGRDWAGDDDFSGVIESARDDFQLKLEAIAHDTGTILEDMAIDSNKLAVPFANYCLWRIWATATEEWAEMAAADFKDLYDRSWSVWMVQFKPDTAQEGAETSERIQRIHQRLRG